MVPLVSVCCVASTVSLWTVGDTFWLLLFYIRNKNTSDTRTQGYAYINSFVRHFFWTGKQNCIRSQWYLRAFCSWTWCQLLILSRGHLISFTWPINVMERPLRWHWGSLQVDDCVKKVLKWSSPMINILSKRPQERKKTYQCWLKWRLYKILNIKVPIHVKQCFACGKNCIDLKLYSIHIYFLAQFIMHNVLSI